jgi:hypothetical protein
MIRDATQQILLQNPVEGDEMGGTFVQRFSSYGMTEENIRLT